MEVSKKDWKLFRACIGEWQEAYMERLTKEYIDLLSGDENASDTVSYTHLTLPTT